MRLLPEGYDVKIDTRMQYDGEPNSIYATFELYKGTHYIGDYESLMLAADEAWRMEEKTIIDENAMQESLLTKDEYIALSNIFHYKFDEATEDNVPTATFPAVVDIVETFLKRKA
jgi:hypothetical protein